MIVSIGVDVCAIVRFGDMAKRNPGAVGKVLTDVELNHKIESQAARFAAKEALAKALGSPGGLAWHDCQIVNDEHGKPIFETKGTIQARLSELQVCQVHLSLSHDGGVAVAFVVLERC